MNINMDANKGEEILEILIEEILITEVPQNLPETYGSWAHEQHHKNQFGSVKP